MLAFGRTASYGEGVTLVLNRSGVLERSAKARMMLPRHGIGCWANWPIICDTKLSPHPADRSDEAARPLLVRQG